MRGNGFALAGIGYVMGVSTHHVSIVDGVVLGWLMLGVGNLLALAWVYSRGPFHPPNESKPDTPGAKSLLHGPLHR
jgi:hypothetical protein